MSNPPENPMHAGKEDILVWLPSPMGDAVLCTPALRTLRALYHAARLTFVAENIVRDVLSPCEYADRWIEIGDSGPLDMARRLRTHRFSRAILLKNSFGSALAVALARIPRRIGYARNGRSFLLTDRLRPRRLANGKFEPRSMLDYYLDIASHLGADTSDRRVSLSVEEGQFEQVRNKLPRVFESKGPLVVFVPGGAFGPSKCWPSDRFARVADRLIEERNATVVVSVAPNQAERRIANAICTAADNEPVNLGEHALTLGQLKALFSRADLVITNDTGPRHIAIALGRKVVTLFGPNDPAWTDTGYEDEVQIVGNTFCAPCAKHSCSQRNHFCMEAISSDAVLDAACGLLDGEPAPTAVYAQRRMVEAGQGLLLDSELRPALEKAGLTSLNAAFEIKGDRQLTKSNLAAYRQRIRLDLPSAETAVFVKRYTHPPVMVQVKNRLSQHRRTSCAESEAIPIGELSSMGINVPRLAAYGSQWGRLLENRSFVAIERIPNADALERKLPGFVTDKNQNGGPTARRDFIERLARFVRRFHETGYRHRDLYLAHIFHDDANRFHLIDLARAFRPLLMRERFRIKDIAQLYYSAPAGIFSMSDRLRFYRVYAGRTELTGQDRRFLRKVVRKANRMAAHDARHGRPAPFKGKRQ